MSPEIIPPAPDVKLSDLKHFSSLEDVERHVRSSLGADKYKREHPKTVMFIRSHLIPL
jgi:hypothetical protein